MNKLIKFCKKLGNEILDLIFPTNTKCIFCKDEIIDFDKTPYCEKCAKEAFNKGTKCSICDTQIKEGNVICDHCKSHRRNFIKCYCPLNYQADVRKSILSFKDSNAKYLAKSYAKIIFDYIKGDNITFDYITYVPSHKKKVKRRGYNPSQVLAEELSILFNKPCIESLLKITETQQQKNLSFNERAKNLENSMIVTNAKIIKGKTILLVDDVVTTCATIDQCAKLLSHFTSKIYASAIARNHLKANKEN